MLQVAVEVIPFLNKGAYDIIHCQFGPNGRLGLLLRDVGIFKGPVITSFLGYDISSYVKKHGKEAYSDLFDRGDLFLCVCEHIRQKMISLGCDQHKVLVHHTGVEIAQGDCVRAYQSERNLKVLTIARLVEKKGIEYGIKAVAEVIKTHHNVRYDIAGEGPMRGSLQSLIDELKLGEKIRLLGWKTQAEITSLLKSSNILLAPSVTASNGDEEGIPGVILEAFSVGLPVVSTCHAGIPEAVKNHITGFVVPERDVDATAERIRQLIDPELRSNLGRAGREFVKRFFDINVLNNQLVEIYHKQGKWCPN